MAAHSLSAKADKDGQVGNANSNHMEEANRVTRNRGQNIVSLDVSLIRTGGQAQQSLTAGKGAQSKADLAVAKISSFVS